MVEVFFKQEVRYSGKVLDFLIINLRIVYVGQEIGISIGFSTISDVRDVLNGDDDVKKGFIK